MNLLIESFYLIYLLVFVLFRRTLVFWRGNVPNSSASLHRQVVDNSLVVPSAYQLSRI